MKLNKSSIFALMTLGGVMAFGPVASADDQTKPVPPPDAPAAPVAPDAPAPRGRRGGGANLDKIVEQLKLSDEQKEKIKPVLKDFAEKRKALMADTSITPEDRRPKIKEIRDATDEKLKTILTDDQFAQWKKLMQGRQGRRNGNNPPGDLPTTPPPAAPPAADNK